MNCRFCDTELIYDYEISKGLCIYHLPKKKKRVLIFDIKDGKQHENKFPLFISPEEKKQREREHREWERWSDKNNKDAPRGYIGVYHA